MFDVVSSVAVVSDEVVGVTSPQLVVTNSAELSSNKETKFLFIVYPPIKYVKNVSIKIFLSKIFFIKLA